MTVSPLSDLHHAIETSTFGDFGGVEIVTSYAEPQLEYGAIHQRCGLIDAPWRGVLEVGGKDRHEFLGNLITNKTWDKATKAGLAAGEGVRAFCLNLKGRVVADLTLIERGDRLLIDVDRRLVAMLATTLDRYVFTEKVTFADRGMTHARLSLIGPGAAAIVYDAGGVDVAGLKPLASTSTTLFGAGVEVWRDDPTTECGLQLLVAHEQVDAVWRGLIDAFAEDGQTSNRRRLRRVGWAAFNAGRIEAGRPMLGIDYEAAAPSVPGKKKDAETETPAATKGILAAETGQFETHVDVTKGCYLGQEIVARMHARNVLARRIVGFRMDDDALPVAGAGVFDAGGAQVGIVTSSAPSPRLSNAGIGLALVKRPSFEAGTIVTIDAEGERRPARIVATPFLARAEAVAAG